MLRIRTALALAALPLLACETNVRVENLPGVVDTVGPVYFDGEELRITFSTYDPEGDAVDIDATFSTGGDFQPIPLPEGSLDNVVSERARSTEHVVVWAIDGVVDASESVTVRFGAPGQAAITFGPFVPDELDDEPDRRPVEDVGTDAGGADASDAGNDADTSSDSSDDVDTSDAAVSDVADDIDTSDAVADVATDAATDTADISDTGADADAADVTGDADTSADATDTSGDTDTDATDTSGDTDTDAADATDATDAADTDTTDVADS